MRKILEFAVVTLAGIGLALAGSGVANAMGTTDEPAMEPATEHIDVSQLGWTFNTGPTELSMRPDGWIHSACVPPEMMARMGQESSEPEFTMPPCHVLEMSPYVGWSVTHW
ncbi:hypothetical protein GCM10012275_43960 [Longimycelium tulufanense]|uniref:Uncharacterized protein n=1 Tax=Longimycelium tulufanense TaxID=907463 RepID=A0A8J3CFR1_9PSEU|nr:hypothetical protein [Longimycelium tulufanense]GGM68707.1 hypothetical protein GCM10012275_43960 [Longimycelium tulufanense]